MYHWGVDNYGDGSTPIFGSQIVGFQGHHQWPWVITQREFCNNMHKVHFCLVSQTKPTAFTMAHQQEDPHVHLVVVTMLHSNLMTTSILSDGVVLIFAAVARGSALFRSPDVLQLIVLS